MDKKIRKEVKIGPNTIQGLTIGAERKGWSLKKYMEFVLVRESLRLQTQKS